MVSPRHDPFERSGLAALSDLQTPQWKETTALLEAEQTAFAAQESRFRSPEYKWSRDPLHTCTRIWEYPYAYHHLRAWAARRAGSGLPRVADVGSGVTFFPFAVAKLGFDVVCSDTDPVAETDMNRAAKVLPHAPGRVSFRASRGARMPFEDGELDAAYCISVLEHVPARAAFVGELARALKPGGLLVLTMDIDLGGGGDISPADYAVTRAALDRAFVVVRPEAFVHPLDMLHSLTGPYPFPRPTAAAHHWNELKQRVIKPLLGRKPGGTVQPQHLAVQGLILERRAELLPE
jgi:SAM-dependent methyltransferase